ncbi:histidine kinase dimerization/phosphoacceptor domain -containing protein [Devosia sp. SD17-2]|uniref:sensor histidine kinase n=1 Tax=Devosia sp. SD17-2 TaxID=2976459 RepID=UPI0023D83343|nr:histidine kinase dimerization/phosphoacceptor domain -containing protein [Devosia sp. SD17-2]WEJ32760.1 hypothetical protein NYQ88_18050 [Devosia sp. SD17-2]
MFRARRIPPADPPGATSRPRSSGQFIGFLYAALVTLALGIAAISFTFDYQRTRDDLENRVEAYAVSLATDVRWYVEVARQTLSRVAEQLGPVSSDVDSTRTLVAALSDLPDGVTMIIYDAEGNSREFIGLTARPVNISDRQYFGQMRDGQNWVISNLITDRVTGNKTFAIGLALRSHGVFQGAAVAYAPPDILSHAWVGIGGDSNAFVVHRGGWITARLPPIDTEVYDNTVSQEFVGNFTASPTGVYWAPASPIDGVTRVLGYSSVEAAPLIAVIGVDPQVELGQFWSRVGVTLATLAPILILLGVASWHMRGLAMQQERTGRKLATSLARNESLLLEIHHRIKNNLQSVLSLVRTQVRNPDILAEIEPRIAAMVSVHEHIYRNIDFVQAPARSYITDIASKVIYASSEQIRLETAIADVDLPSEIVMPIGQLVNEAIINAVKYGYPDGRSGTISIRMEVDASGMADLSIHNDGDPLPERKASGIGRRLMESFAAQARGTLHTASSADGVTVSLRFPLGPPEEA